jgi:hypothetical protein
MAINWDSWDTHTNTHTHTYLKSGDFPLACAFPRVVRLNMVMNPV